MYKIIKNMAIHNERGKEGEDQATEFLQKKDYTILHRNWRSGKKELDIVAEKDNTLIVIEVKTRQNNNFGSPVEAINTPKIRRIVSATDAYLKKYEIDLPVRFDIISLVGTHPPFEIEHIEDAFYPPLW